MPGSEFKCIHCGEEKRSVQPCACPVCGYRMFQMPYGRADVLRREITGFIRHLEITAIHDGDMIFFRQKTTGKRQSDGTAESAAIFKVQDDLRFPDFQKIQDYVCAADGTETFFERLHTSVEETGRHIHAPYAQEYDVSLEPLKTAQQNGDAVLRRALSEFGFQAALPEIDWPEMTLAYTEEPNVRLLPAADRLLSLLPELSEKIRRFIKSNNIFGTVFRTRPKTSKWLATDKYEEALLRCAAEVEKTLKKTYVVDILSDGTDELSEMLRVLWNGVYCLQAPSLLTKTYTYHIGGITIVGDAVHELLLARIAPHYADIEEVLSSGELLNGKSEAELFALYDRMIELDASGFMGVDRDQLIRFGESEKKLQKLVGLAEIKKSIQKIKAYAIANQGADDLNLHMCFCGNPGTGKTEVARLIAGILHENKILPTDHVVEVDRGGLVGQYMGETAQKTARMIQAAMGGVLFVDEAYALAPKNGGYDYGQEAIATLIKAMEDYRGEFCVILAGYKSEMTELLSQNPGFRSRIQFFLDFPNYSREELGQILELMLESKRYTISKTARDRVLDITDIERKRADFANARAVRNILNQVIMCQNLRSVGTEDTEIGIVDVERYIKDAGIQLPRALTGDGTVLSGDEELEQLVGLASVKRMVRKIRAYAKKNRQDADFNMHMCFYGNPGTGKTEVARIISRLLYEAGALEEAKLVETDAYGLLGTCVGETAPKTMRKIEEAMGGVLFVDEAYSLAGTNLPEAGVRSNYGDEALAVLLKEMEDRRGRFCVIFAGYKDEMQKMLSTNPGLNSRIQFKLDFPDYTREELGDIALLLLKKKGYEITGEALSLVLDISDYERKRPNFANARTVRNILDQVIMNQNLRTEDDDGDHTVALQDVKDYLEEEAIDLHAPAEGARTIGFV